MTSKLNKPVDSWNPQQYQKFKDERAKPFFDLLDLVEKKPAMRVIDLGCGTGELTAHLHHHLEARETVGMDSSPEMLKKAEKVLVSSASADHSVQSSLRFENGDIETWNSGGDQNQAWNLIFSNAALQWCDHHDVLFERFRDALVSVDLSSGASGQIALQMPMNQDYPTHTVARAMAREISPDFTIQDSMLSLENYASMLHRLGFRRQHASVRVYAHLLESREGIIEWVKGTTLTRFKERLSPSDYEFFIKEYRTRLFRELPDEKPFFYPFKRVLLWGSL